MMTLADSTPFNPTRRWLRSGTLSILVHFCFLAVILVFGKSPIPQDDQVIAVTLVERPSMDQAQPQEEAPPPLLSAPRSFSPPPVQQSIRREIPFSSSLASPTAVTVPTPQPRTVSKPMPRRVLQDSKAADTLTMQSLLKMAQPSPRKFPSAPARQTLSPPTAPTTPSQDIWTQDRSSIRRPQSRPSRPRHRPLRLSAAGSTHPSPSGNTVQLGKTIPPVYPRIAREQGWEGTVVLRVSIQPDGRPGRLIVRKSSGYEILDKAALDAVRSWRFIPARDGNFPIQSAVEIPIHFDLRQARKMG